jgi:hypothetical protein
MHSKDGLRSFFCERAVAPSIGIVAKMVKDPVAGERDINVSRSLQSDGVAFHKIVVRIYFSCAMQNHFI